jgi:hypothetical protein
VAFDKRTEIIYYERVSREHLKRGTRIAGGGPYSDKEGWKLRWVEVASNPVSYLQEKSDGLKINKEGNYANGHGTLKSVSPFVMVDDKGKEFRPDTSRLRGVWRVNKGDRNTLLIGTRVGIAGVEAPDGVLQAKNIYPDRGQAPFGTMFGTLLSVNGNRVTIRPRFTQETLPVTLTDKCQFLQQVTLDESAVKTGQRLTFWGEPRDRTGTRRLRAGEKSTDLKAFALLFGDNRFPSAQGSDAPGYFTGELVSLDPEVRLKLPKGNSIRVFPTAQMPIARLETIAAAQLQPGRDAMFVLSRRADGSFQTSTIILDASPWVGYGQ